MRQTCPHCRRPQHYCYCHLIQKIETPITFAILIHHLEARRKIATGRMAHLCLKDSLLIRGDDFTHNDEVNQLIQDSNNHCLLLYPGADALNLSDPAFSKKREALIHPSKKTILFIVDGTWSSARKTIRLSENLRRLPTFCFTPNTPSQFRIRKQPAPECYSTIEAIHHILELLSGQSDRHDLLLTVFNRMVEQQIGFTPILPYCGTR